MTIQRQDELEIALWRYGIISAALNRNQDDPNLAQTLESLAKRSWQHPGGRQVVLSPETLRKWLYRYRIGGIRALETHERSDKGSHQVPQKLMDAICELRKEHPRWTLARLFKELLETGIWNGVRPARSSLYRFACRHGLKRDPSPTEIDPMRSFEFSAFGELWIADFMEGPKLRFGREKKRIYLHVIIDDCTRFVVGAGFYFSQTVEVLLEEMKTAIRRLGIPRRFYTDNGPCYASRHLKIVCARLGVHLVHSRPYRPQGRGKVERIFRTVRDQFLCDPLPADLTLVNQSFEKWLSEYHRRIHSSTGLSPTNRRLAVENHCRTLPDVADIEALFRMERRCRVYNDGTVRLFGRIFEVPGAPPGSRTTVYFLPWDFSRVCYGPDMNRAIPLDRNRNAFRLERPAKGEAHAREK